MLYQAELHPEIGSSVLARDREANQGRFAHVSHWIGDLSYSNRNVRGAGLREGLDALCCVLENAERGGSAARGEEEE